MGIFHKHDYKPERTDTEINGVTIKSTKVVKCSCCGKEGVSHVSTKLDPRFRNKVIDSQ